MLQFAVPELTKNKLEIAEKDHRFIGTFGNPKAFLKVAPVE